MPIQIPVASGRLVLRPWQDPDRQAFAELSADADVMQYLMPIPTQQASDAWIDRQQEHLRAHGFCMWAVALSDTGEFIGTVGLLRVRYEAHFTPGVEVGWRLARRYWGYGYAPEAAEAALRFGFDSLHLNEIVANTVPINMASRRVMEKIGMLRDPIGDFDHPLVPEGHPLRRQVLYRLTRGDWLSRLDGSVRDP
jgi:ribosomal-protein-alanine N-acetyltransferase